MAALDNVLTILNKWPLWHRVTETPDKVDDLDRRVAALEEKLGDTWPPDVCKFCGEREVRLVDTRLKEKGFVLQIWQCYSCDGEERRVVKP